MSVDASRTRKVDWSQGVVQWRPRVQKQES